jgi:hypothetical protein
MALFFMYDEFTDKVDGDGARLYAEMVMDAIRNPHKERPQGEPQLGEIARQYVCVLVNIACIYDDRDFDRFWLRAIKVSSPAAQTRFISSFSEYVFAVIDEASDRTRGRIRGIEDYLQLTRLTAGGYPSFVAVEAGLNIPDEAMAHPALVSLCSLAAESLVLTNVGDIFPGFREHIYLTPTTIGHVFVQYRAGFGSRRTQHRYRCHERKGSGPRWRARLAWGIPRTGLGQVPGTAPHGTFLGSYGRL